MSIDPALGAAASTSATLGPAAPEPEALGKEVFLELLVAQIQNQNPLDPSDPAEFLGQLASFSSLEQMGNINDSLESVANLQAIGLTRQTTDMVGRRVSYEGQSARVVDGQATFTVQVPQDVPELEVTYRDGTGAEQTKTLSGVKQGRRDVVLDDLDGENVTIVRVEAKDGSGEVLDLATPVYTTSVVDGVKFMPDGSVRLLIGGQEVEPKSVIEVLQ